MYSKLKFDNSSNREFSAKLRDRVNQYFKDNNETMHANSAMVLRTLLVLSFHIGIYLYIMLGSYSVAMSYVLWFLLGLGMVWSTINIGHDAIHGSYSKNRFVNWLLSHTFNFNGASAYMWSKMHNSAHHTYTNVQGYDEDVESVPFLRLSPETDYKPIHKHQYKFAFLVYGFATLSWVFIKDYVKFFKNEVGNFAGEKHPTKEYFLLFLYKFINYTLFIVIPFSVIELPWYHILGGFLLMHYIAGMYLALVFMLAHIVEKAHFPVPNEINTLENSWLVHQLYTTANFGEKSLVMGFLTGGLNTQVEHHLFPNICSIHYRKLSEVVKQTAEEYDLPYYTYPGFLPALKSHFNFLKQMGSPSVTLAAE